MADLTDEPGRDLDAELGDVRAALDAAMDTNRAELERLVAIPSVSAPGFDPGQVRRCAEAVGELLAARGLEHTRLLELDGAHPAVYGEWLHAGPQAPTVLCYAHHDVQPPGDEARWHTPPFEPTQRHARLYGRGAADDKAGVMVHAAAVDAWLSSRGALPVNLKVIVEGEEETGSPHLAELLAGYAELLRSDVMILTDTMNWQVGTPSLTYLLRGLVDCEVSVAALDHPVHSGMYGGPVPDPLTGLTKLLAAATDEHGEPAVPGFTDDLETPTADERARIAALDFDEGRFRGEAGLLDGVELAGNPSVYPLERLWLRPHATIIGLDAQPVAGSSNTIPASARARLSVRLGPGQDPVRARELLCQWLSANAPWGLATEVTPGAAGNAFAADPEHPASAAGARALGAAYGSPAVFTGLGGSIPFVAPFVEAFGGVPALLTGVEDPDTRAHGIDESLHLDDWRRACLGEAYLLDELARTDLSPRDSDAESSGESTGRPSGGL
jgi:acetylornithine deacetylase/succinyl-diaminopimelate desuccinylase-like protein